jgi:rare lipoprotein A
MRATESSKLSAHPHVFFPVQLSRIEPFRIAGFVWLAGMAALALGGCAQQPVDQHASHSKEYFPGSIYGRPSPRVVAYGEPVPRGGGIYLVGKPYSVAGQMFYPTEKQRATIGLASWYGEAFHGRRTANGEVYDCDAISAAHPTMPLPSYARITNLENRRSLIVRVNDRGPFHADRVVDASRKTAQLLDFHGTGTTRVKIEYVGPADLAGSDDSSLLATLRTNGPAVFARKDHPSDLEVASALPSSPTAGVTIAPRPDRPEAPMPPVREAVDQHLPEPATRKAVASAVAAPLPPARPQDTWIRAPSSSSNATRIARASSDKPALGH